MAGDGDARAAAVRRRTQAEITHPDRVLYPEPGLTKLDVVEYYLKIAPFLLPYLHDRPLTLHRFPGGVGEAGFFEKDAPAAARVHAPDVPEREHGHEAYRLRPADGLAESVLRRQGS